MFDGPVVPLAIKSARPCSWRRRCSSAIALIDTLGSSPVSIPLRPRSLRTRPCSRLLLFMALSQSISIGVASLVGRVIGRNDRDLAQHIIRAPRSSFSRFPCRQSV